MSELLGPESDSLMMLTMFRRFLRANYAEVTAMGYFATIFRFLTFCPKPLVEVAEQDVAAWLETYPFRSSARRSGYQALKVLFDWMEQHRLLVVNPMRLIRVPPVVEKKARALTPEEFRAVHEAAMKRSPARGHTIALLYYSGARLNEVYNLRWEDVKTSFVLLRITKNGRERRVPITPDLHDALVGLADKWGTEPKSKVVPRTKQTIWQWCRDAGRDSGIDRVHPHLFRSTAVTDMLNNGAPVQAVKEMVGHANIKTTNRYAAATYDDVVDAAARLNGVRAHDAGSDLQSESA